MVCFVGGLLGVQFRVVRRLAPERFAAIATAVGLCVFGGRLPGLVVVASIAVVLAAMQAITWRKFRTGALARMALRD